MSDRKKRRSDLAILAGAVFCGGLLLVGLVALGVLQAADPGEPFLRSSFSGRRDGTLGFYRLARRLGVPIARNLKPLLGPQLEPAGAVFLIDPHPQQPFNDGERQALLEWVAQGGALVCTRDVVDELGLDVYGGTTSWLTGIGEPGEPTDLAPDANAGPLGRQVRQVHLASESVLEAAPQDPNRARTLLADRHGPRIVAVPHGRGALVVLADSSFLANRWLNEADNAVLAMNLTEWLLAGSDGRPLVFDEHHLGQGRYDSALGALSAAVFYSPPGWGALTAAAAGACWLVYKGRRFGTRRRPPRRAHRRTKIEYVHAVGDTLRRAGARRETLRTLLEAYLDRAAMRVGLDASATPEAIAARLARRSGRSADSYLEVILDCRDALDQDARIGQNAFDRLVDALGRLEAELHSPAEAAAASGTPGLGRHSGKGTH